jgi:hypothetical protein
MVKIRDEMTALDLGALRTLDCHPEVTGPLEAYHAVSRQIVAAQQALSELDKQLSVVIGRAREEMVHVSLGNHTAIDALVMSPLAHELQLRQQAVKQEITALRPVLAEAEYRLSIARSDARAQVRRQIAQDMRPALAALLQCLEAMEGPNSTITALETHRRRLLLEAIDPTMWEQRLEWRIKRTRQRLSALTPPAEEASPDAANC